MKKLYYISGLGADERVFNYLEINQVSLNYIKWERPQKNESIQEYCRRLSGQIDYSAEIILVGVSFGGIIAQEIAKIISVDKVIIISSIKSEREFDWRLKLVSNTHIHRLFPSWFLKWCNLLTADYFFGTETKSESDLLKLIIKDTDRIFLKWAINETMNWKNQSELGKAVIHIHGTSDRIFPIRNIKNPVKIKNGGHFMILNKAKEISETIGKQIE